MTIAPLAPAWSDYLTSLDDDEHVDDKWTDRDEAVVREAEADAERNRENILKLVLHTGQIVTMNAIERFIFMIAGTGGGKTIFAPRWMYREIAKHQNEPIETQNYLVFAPSYKVLKRATLPAYVRLFHALKLGVFKRGELVYELRNGGKVYFGSCDNPESLEGLHVRAAHGDELGQNSVSLEVWETVRRRLAFFEGRFLGTTTPYNLGWLKQHVVDPFVAGLTRGIIRVIGFPSIANPMYPREEFERMRATLPRWKFRMFGLGEFDRPEGLIFDIFDEARHVCDPFSIPPKWHRYAGQDFGLKHPTGTLFGTLDPRPYPNDVLYLYSEYRRSERATPEHVADIKKIGGQITKMWADPRSVQLVKDYRAAGLPIEPASAGPGSVKATIQEVYTRLKENADDGLPRLRIFRGLLPGWQDEVERYEWAKDAAGNPTDKPVEYADDLMDCTRYLCGGINGPKSEDLPKPSARAERARPIAAGLMEKRF